MLFSGAEWAQSKLGMNQSRSEEKRMMFVQTRPKKRKMARSPLETGAIAGAYDFKDEDIVVESGPALSSTLGEEWRLAMSKHVKQMVLLCSLM